MVQAACSDRWIVAGDLILFDLVTGTRCAVDTAGTDVTSVQWIDQVRPDNSASVIWSVAGVIEVRDESLPETISARELAASEQSWASWSIRPALSRLTSASS